MKNLQNTERTFVEDIKQLLRQAYLGVSHAVNSIMAQTYFEMGKRIVEQATYGKFLLETLSNNLTKEFGKGYSKRNLELIRKFYLVYRNTKSVISQSLSWTHYLHLMRVENPEERAFYEIETIK
jgi:hypothetical protein